MAQYRQCPIQPLETSRLKLVPLSLGDADRIQELFPNPEQLKYMHAAIPWPYPEDGAITFLKGAVEKMAALEEYYWGITLPGEGLIGVISLTPNGEDHRGFWLAQAFWGQGYMREAVAAVQDFGFEVLGMDEMLLNNAQANVASHRLKEKAGAEIIEIVETDYISGRLPGVRWRLTREAWRESRDAFLS